MSLNWNVILLKRKLLFLIFLIWKINWKNLLMILVGLKGGRILILYVSFVKMRYFKVEKYIFCLSIEIKDILE